MGFNSGFKGLSVCMKEWKTLKTRKIDIKMRGEKRTKIIRILEYFYSCWYEYES